MENEREVLVEVNHLNVTYGSGRSHSLFRKSFSRPHVPILSFQSLPTHNLFFCK